ncbi:hypothetical protein A306_00000086 [Columba livia]|uniref:Uncharacterized protein n=1 Tax=Columba livia TaxID=8932 RepID=A0A2I0MLK1_COLLI|nr:hypothetical protein A306_00000086 [Columba livia]
MGEHLFQSDVSTHCNNCVQTPELWRWWGNRKRLHIWQRFWAHMAGPHQREQHSSLWQCQSDPWDPHSCDNRAEETHISCTGMTEMTASSTRADPPHHPATERTRISTPVIICIFLGALLCLVLAILAGQIQSARVQQRGSRVSYDPFSEAVYEEINSNLMMEKQGMTGLPGLCVLLL